AHIDARQETATPPIFTGFVAVFFSSNCQRRDYTIGGKGIQIICGKKRGDAYGGIGYNIESLSIVFKFRSRPLFLSVYIGNGYLPLIAEQ
ncbi:hypothetical protein OCV51_14315, partial [Faecalicatena acetigenes]